MTDIQGKPLLSIEEACEFLNLSKPTVYRLIRRGILERKKVAKDRHCYITLESLDNYRVAQNFTLEELASRLLSVERKVNFLMSKPTADRREVREAGQDLDAALRSLKKHHPDIYN